MAVGLIYESSQNEYSSSPIPESKTRTGVDSDGLRFLTQLEDKFNVFKMFGVSRCAELLLTCVDRKYRNQGLGTEMFRRSLSMLKQRGFPMAKGIFSSPISRRIGEKIGFEELARSYLCEFRENPHESVHFNNETGDQFLALMSFRFY